MAKSDRQKMKILYLAKILQENTDEEHGMTTQQLIHALKQYEIAAERKSIYGDIDCLIDFGLDIVKQRQGQGCVYYIGARKFELAELKMLVDAVQSSRFITAQKSDSLIRKLESLTSVNEASQLQRQVYNSGRVRNGNESIYYNVDYIYEAINQNVQISFQYMQWNLKKEFVPRHNGEWYLVSPWMLCYAEENYYLIAYDEKTRMLRHYRVDKMKKISLQKEAREGKKFASKKEMAAYAGGRFGMFTGEQQSVVLECTNDLVGVILDRFGKDVMLIQEDEMHFTVRLSVAVNRQLFGWIMSLGAGAKLIEPASAVEEMQKEIQRMQLQYSTGAHAGKNTD